MIGDPICLIHFTIKSILHLNLPKHTLKGVCFINVSDDIFAL
jgi:hypothetical protein